MSRLLSVKADPVMLSFFAGAGALPSSAVLTDWSLPLVTLARIGIWASLTQEETKSGKTR